MAYQHTHEDDTFIAPDMFGTLDHEAQIQAHIAAGKLPFDTYFRIRAIGECQPDWLEENRNLQFQIAQDITQHIDAPEKMRADTQRLLWGERPNAVVDWEQRAHITAYPTLEPMYYRMANLARVIKRRRIEEGSTVTEVPSNWYASVDEVESARCFGLARPIWRTLVQRTHPEWLAHPSHYCAPVISFNQVYYSSERRMQRLIVGAAVISDTVVLDIYNEAATTGVKGIGPKGRESLRELLTDEHPELIKL